MAIATPMILVYHGPGSIRHRTLEWRCAIYFHKPARVSFPKTARGCDDRQVAEAEFTGHAKGNSSLFQSEREPCWWWWWWWMNEEILFFLYVSIIHVIFFVNILANFIFDKNMYRQEADLGPTREEIVKCWVKDKSIDNWEIGIQRIFHGTVLKVNFVIFFFLSHKINTGYSVVTI